MTEKPEGTYWPLFYTPIPVEVEPDDVSRAMRCFERCCFCWRPTNTWYTEKDVAVCSACACSHKPEEVPTKEEWGCQREGLDATRIDNGYPKGAIRPMKTGQEEHHERAARRRVPRRAGDNLRQGREARRDRSDD